MQAGHVAEGLKQDDRVPVRHTASRHVIKEDVELVDIALFHKEIGDLVIEHPSGDPEKRIVTPPMSTGYDVYKFEGPRDIRIVSDFVASHAIVSF